MILELLYQTLERKGDQIQFSRYDLSDDVMTLLLKKYDEEKFKEYERKLLKERGEEDE